MDWLLMSIAFVGIIFTFALAWMIKKYFLEEEKKLLPKNKDSKSSLNI